MASKSSEIVANNDDLLKEILVKLPLKSLMRFTSVSKHWLSFISGPYFNSRRNPFPGSVSGLFLPSGGNSLEYDFMDLNQSSDPTNPPFRSLNFTNDPLEWGIKIVHSCNGLLLCSGTGIYLYNPTTKKYTVLPLPSRSRFACGLSLAFDPSRSPHYKVVCVSDFDPIDEDDEDNRQIEMYSSETGTWRLSGDSFYAPITSQFRDGVFWNGSVHWINLWGTPLYFNVEEERLSHMPLPPVPVDWDGKKKIRYFGESHGHLHLINRVYDPTTLEFDVYEMETDYSGWFVKFRVDWSQIRTAFPEIKFICEHAALDHLQRLYDLFAIVYIDPGDVNEESYAIIKVPGKLIRYNFKSKAIDNLCDLETEDYDDEWFPWEFKCHQYIESLALV
ncbi:hypothetical protein UlMin_026390 [Ulmus minor]